MRDISSFGRVLLSKTEGISRSVYVSLSLNVPTNVIKQLDKILHLEEKTHYLRKETIKRSREQGGLEVLDFSLLNNTFKVKWLIKFLKNPDSIWYAFPSYLFNSIGGIDFLLKCNFPIDKIPVSLANFHKQALLARLLHARQGPSAVVFVCVFFPPGLLSLSPPLCSPGAINLIGLHL